MLQSFSKSRTTRVAGLLQAALVLCALQACRLHSGENPPAARPDLVIADFEAQDYDSPIGRWQPEGGAFGQSPARGTLANQMPVSGFEGRGLVNSFLGGDAGTGALSSPAFTIQRTYLCFLIGGGHDPERLSFELHIEDGPVLRATGFNRQPGGSEALAPACFDLSAHQGSRARLVIRDTATGGWGHINVDSIRLSDSEPANALVSYGHEWRIHKRYLEIPIQNGAPMRPVVFRLDGEELVRNDIELAVDRVDWWAVMDLEDHAGRKLLVSVDGIPKTALACSGMQLADAPRDAARLYREELRSQLRFSPRRGWNNDPNGLVHYNGEYHLFFQHNPYGWSWGNMHWGHAVSSDLVHWRELGDALAPDRFGPMFSGSAVVDVQNTSGLGSGGKPPLVLIYTAAGSPTVQCVASSMDGRRFTKHAANPVLAQVTPGNRDPKVIWHAPTQRWVMVLYVELPGRGHTVHFYTSPNLLQWELASITDGVPGTSYLFECPDFYELAVDGDPTNTRWVLSAADGEYAIGRFDGRRFTPEATRLRAQFGPDFYAPQTFSDDPHGRRIWIGWFRQETRGMSFNQSMTSPQELSLVSTPAGPRLRCTPLPLPHGSERIHPARTLSAGERFAIEGADSELVEIRARLRAGGGNALLTVRGVELRWLSASGELLVANRRVRAPAVDGVQELQVRVDRVGVEIFASSGQVYLPLSIQPDPGLRGASIVAEGASMEVPGVEARQLRPVWD